jgi:inhibitor of KinA sporulation pathway (predicted exonuclease)
MSHYIVMDLEWNQNPSCHPTESDALTFEVIEIGAVKLSEHLEIESEFERLIRPCVYRKMNWRIAEVTHLTMKELMAGGVGFQQAMKEFLAWCGDDAIFCTWGDMDLTELQRNIVYHGMDLPFPVPFLFYDLQKIYGMIRGGNHPAESLDHACEALGIHSDRPFHRAEDDAWYTARVMQEMGFASRSAYFSVDYFTLPEGEDIFDFTFPDFKETITHAYAGREEALADRSLTRICCPRCGRALRKKIRWFTANQKYYYCLAVCPDHGYVCGKIRFKKAETGGVFAIRETRLTDETGVDEIAGRKEYQRKKRAARNHRASQSEKASSQRIQLPKEVIKKTRRRKILDK